MKKITPLLLILFSTSLLGQELIHCNETLSFWYFTNPGQDYALKINGKASTTNRLNAIAVDDYLLQFIMVSKKPFEVEDDPNEDLDLMTRFALSEANNMSMELKANLDITMKMASSGSQKILLWSYPMPKKHNKEVKYQLYANVILGDYIFGLASPLFKGQDIEKIIDFLTDTIASLSTVSDKNKLCAP